MIGFAERRGLAPLKAPEVAAHRLPWRALHDAHSIAALALPWLAFACLLGWAMRGQIDSLSVGDPDDAMRLLQVRAWMDGQSWWDVTNYRAGGAEGFSMHWSRLVDVPIAALILLFGLFLQPELAERAAMTLLPLFQLLLALFILRGTLRCLGFRDAAANIVLLVVPLLPLVVGNMVPLKIDHHAWQAICALLIVRLMVDRRNVARQTLLAGAVAAMLVTISIEGLPLVATVCAIYAMLFLHDASERGLSLFLTGLASSSAILFVATIHPSLWTEPRADAIGWPHLAGFASAALVAQLLIRSNRSGAPIGRAMNLLAVALCGAAPVLLVFGAEGVAPFGGLDPLVRQYWLSGIQEVRPVFQLTPDAGAMLGWMVALFLLALAAQAPKRLRGETARGWFVVFMLAGSMLALSLVVYRTALIAQILMVPLLAAMLYDTLRSASRFDSPLLRVGATASALILLSPTAGSLLGKAALARGGTQIAGSSEIIAGECDVTRLAGLVEGRVLASVDMGPVIMLKTPLSVAAAPYHRNEVQMRAVVSSFTSPESVARAAVLSTGSDYVAICRNTPDMARYAQAGPDSLAALLIADQAPPWLEPVSGFDTGAFRVWRVRQVGLKSSATPLMQ